MSSIEREPPVAPGASEPTVEENRRFERFSFRFARFLSRRWPKTLAIAYMHGLGSRLVRACTNRLLHVHGLEDLSFRPDDRILLVSNHHSFFDQYVLSTVLYCLKSCRAAALVLFPGQVGFHL